MNLFLEGSGFNPLVIFAQLKIRFFGLKEVLKIRGGTMSKFEVGEKVIIDYGGSSKIKGTVFGVSSEADFQGDQYAVEHIHEGDNLICNVFREDQLEKYKPPEENLKEGAKFRTELQEYEVLARHKEDGEVHYFCKCIGKGWLDVISSEQVYKIKGGAK